MAEYTSMAEDRIIGEAEHISNTVAGLIEIINRLDGELGVARTELADANDRIAELEREIEKYQAEGVTT